MPRTATILFVLVAILGALSACAPDDRDQQLAALARWEDRRLAPADSLTTLLASPDAVIRRAALRSAGLIGRTEALPAMIERLEDTSQAVRAQAAFSLGLLGGEAAVAPLTRALNDPHVAVRVAAIDGLAHQQHDGSVLYQPALYGETREAEAAWTALRNVAALAARDSLVAAIRAALARTETSVRWRVLRCAERAPDSTLVDQIAAYVVDHDVQVRVHALRALEQQSGSAALDAVLRSHERHGRLKGRSLTRVEIAELRALGRLAQPVLAADREGDHTSLAGKATAALVDGAQSEDPHVAETALVAMASATADLDLPGEAVAQESLLPVWRIRMVRAARQRLADLTPAVRDAACVAVAALRRAGARDEIERMLDDGDPTVRAAATGALVRLDLAEAALQALVARALSDQAPVRVALLTALAGTVDDEADPTAACAAFAAGTAGMVDPDFTVRTTAAELLGHFGGGLVCHELVRGYDRAGSLDEGAADVRLAVLGSLERVFDPGFVAAPPFGDDCDAARPDTLATNPLRTIAIGDAHRTAAAALLQQAFDDPDLRIRMAARGCAETTGLLEAALIPAAASLRETMPAVQRDPRQPAVCVPYRSSQKVRCITDRGSFVIELDTEAAPNTCAAFLALVVAGFHDDLTFHRVVPDFVIQGGCPRGDGWGGPGWTIRSEWSRLPFERGTVGIAHSGKDTGGSQWFVCHSPQPHLDGHYTVFGRVVEGLEVVDRIQRGDRYRLGVVVEQ